MYSALISSYYLSLTDIDIPILYSRYDQIRGRSKKAGVGTEVISSDPLSALE